MMSRCSRCYQYADRCSGCEALLHNIETQVTNANTRKDKESKIALQIEQEVNLTLLSILYT